MGKPWGILEPSAGDRELADLLEHQLFPGGDHTRRAPDPVNPEAAYLRPTPFGESFDVQLTSASAATLSSYPVLLLAGDIEFEPALVANLGKALRAGRTVLVGPRHRAALGERFEELAKLGKLEALESWVNPRTGRPAAIRDDRLLDLVRANQPIHVSGDPIQYQVNRTARGWVIELVHNGGVVKRPNDPAVVDPAAVARVRLTLRDGPLPAVEWRSGRRQAAAREFTLQVGPGRSEFVEFEVASAPGAPGSGGQDGKGK